MITKCLIRLQIYFGTAHARIYLISDFVRVNCATGMSSLMRKSLIDEAGGLKAFGCYLAEDYFLAKSIKDRGWRIRISHQPAWQNIGNCAIPSFQARITRWAKLRIAMVPFTIVFEPISECMMLGALAAWATCWLFACDPIVVYLLHILCWFLLDWILLSIVQVRTSISSFFFDPLHSSCFSSKSRDPSRALLTLQVSLMICRCLCRTDHYLSTNLSTSSVGFCVNSARLSSF